MKRENAGHLDQGAGARAAIIRADEANRIEDFRVVMRAEKENRLLFAARRKIRHEIDEAYFSARRVRVNACGATFHPDFQLLCDVSARFFECFRAGRARPEINQRLDMSQSVLPGKFLPRLPRGLGRFLCACAATIETR